MVEGGYSKIFKLSHARGATVAESLAEAMGTRDVPTRYACAHVAALRATAALLAARATPTSTPRRGRQQKNAWVLLAEVAPELGEWAAFFAAGASKRAAAESGSRRAVTEREADDLVRQVEEFEATVRRVVGLPVLPPATAMLVGAGVVGGRG